MVPSNVNDRYVIRFCVVAADATESDVGKHNKGGKYGKNLRVLGEKLELEYDFSR